MIKQIEIINFENHAHTVLTGFADGFNLIFGDSDIGKTSILRALRLICFQEFTQDSVRLGAENCEITVTTDKGVVRVIRGKENSWEVTPNGQPTKYFKRIGKEILQDAADVLGIKIIKLGSCELPIALMNQLEGHFLLSEIGGSSASGSLRAQSIDEISGLTGTEDLVKLVSLDNLRNSKLIKECEDKNLELLAQLHDEAELNKESSRLNNVETLLARRDEDFATIEVLRNLQEEHSQLNLDLLNDSKALSALPDTLKPADLVTKANEALMSLTEGKRLLGEFQQTQTELDGLKKSQSVLPDTTKVSSSLQSVGEALLQIKELETTISEIESVTNELANQENQLAETEKTLQRLYNDREVILKSVKVCPLTDLPINPECLKGARQK